MNELKTQTTPATLSGKAEELASPCDSQSTELTNEFVKIPRCPSQESIADQGYPEKPEVDESKDLTPTNRTNNRKDSLIPIDNALPIFSRHLGVLLFGDILNDFGEKFDNGLLKQFFVSILLGAKNIEQTKHLNFNSLRKLLGEINQNLHGQRIGLTKLAENPDNRIELLKINAQLIQAEKYNDFYYDPHIKRYTGATKILKGWCASRRNVYKIINMDFFHLAPDGHPVYLENVDNFYDIRERFIKEVKALRTIVGNTDQVLTFIIDRGIYSFEIFEKIIADPKTNIITWEKGYKRDEWDESEKIEKFINQKERNNSRDLVTYSFEYIAREWSKNNGMNQIIVRATNPKKRTIEVSILCSDKERNAEEVILLMLTRWIQENDFKYGENHFGINSITSYKSLPYETLRNAMEDKDCTLGEYKAIEQTENETKAALKKALYKEKTGKPTKKRKEELKNEIERITKKLERLKKEKATTQKKGSKLEELINKELFMLNTDNKEFMDCIKILARNAFYKALSPFKERYDNFRDDHAIFRNLTKSDGFIKSDYDYKKVEITLYPVQQYPPKIRKIIKEVLQEINMKKPKYPDKSGRIMKIKLGEKLDDNIVLLQSNAEKT